jgi:hypothetical protein
MKHFCSHALMLLVRLSDDGRSERIVPSKIDTRTTDDTSGRTSTLNNVRNGNAERPAIFGVPSSSLARGGSQW